MICLEQHPMQPIIVSVIVIITTPTLTFVRAIIQLHVIAIVTIAHVIAIIVLVKVPIKEL